MQKLVYRKVCPNTLTCGVPSHYDLDGIKPNGCGNCGEDIRDIPERKALINIPVPPKRSGDCETDDVYKITCDCGEIIRYSMVAGVRPNYCPSCRQEIRYKEVRRELVIMPDIISIKQKAEKPCTQSQ